MKLRNKILLLFFLFFIKSILLFAQESEYPAWIYLEKGKSALENRQKSRALDYLFKAIELQKNYPEAEYWLGRVYEAQGQKDLAFEQYRRAIDLSLYLRTPQDLINYKYSLASLLLEQGEKEKREAELILYSILDSNGENTPEKINLVHRYINTVAENGPDELLFLYRDSLGPSLKARRMLGEISWNNGEYRTSLLNSTLVFLSLLSSSADMYHYKYPSWRFDIDPVKDPEYPDRDVRYPSAYDGTRDLINRIYTGEPEIRKYLENTGFWPQLYLMSISLYSLGFKDSAESVWKLMTEYDEYENVYKPVEYAGIWGNLSAEQLKKPFITNGSIVP